MAKLYYTESGALAEIENDKVYMSREGYEEKKAYLKYLQTEKRDEIVARITEARSHGDLSENAEYDAARNEQASNEGEIFEIYTAPSDVYSVKEGLEGAGYKIVSAEVEKVPSNYVTLDAEQAIKMNRLLDALEENDDVQNVWHNWENDDE